MNKVCILEDLLEDYASCATELHHCNLEEEREYLMDRLDLLTKEIKLLVAPTPKFDFLGGALCINSILFLILILFPEFNQTPLFFFISILQVGWFILWTVHNQRQHYF